jgi:hypothetical protein
MSESMNLNDNELDELIRRELLSVSAPAELRQKLLQPELLAPRARGWFGVVATNGANDSVFRRLLPVAASLVIALGIAFWSTDFSAGRDALADEIFSHIYLEGQLDNANAAIIPLATVNTRLENWMGAHLDEADMEDLKVTFAKDCWVAKQMAFHMIMKGETGAITVMMIPNEGGAASEFNISDDTYSGLVTPTDGGYLVVIGNKREPLTAYRNLLSGKLEWEY